MTALYAGLLLLFVPHFLVYTPLRQSAVAALGERGWRLSFTAVSLIGFALLVWGYWGTRAGPAAADIVWYPPDGLRHITMLLVLLAMTSTAAAFTKGHLKIWLRNPMAIGVSLWAAGHLLVNGKYASILLFGSFLALGLTDIAVNTARGTVPAHEPRASQDAVAVICGLALYAFFLLIFHPYVLNLPVIQ